MTETRTTSNGIPWSVKFDAPQGMRIEMRPKRLKKHMQGITKAVGELHSQNKDSLKIVCIMPSKMNFTK